MLIAVSAIFTLMALFFLGTMLRQTRRGRPLRATFALAAVAISASLAALVILVGTSYLGYQRLTEEKLVGLIEFSRNAPDEYSARLMIDGQLDRLLTLRGDEWQLDARIITWQPPATILGLEPVYQLERLSGRYSSIDRELSEPRTVHGLAEERALDLWSLARDFPRLTPGVDAFYGSATYLPMADGARFRITLSRDAIIARPVNDSARRAVGDWGQLAK